MRDGLWESMQGDKKAMSTFIIAEAGPSASLCLLAEPILELPDRTLRFCDPIKIMNDRMLEYSSKVKRQLYGNAI